MAGKKGAARAAREVSPSSPSARKIAQLEARLARLEQEASPKAAPKAMKTDVVSEQTGVVMKALERLWADVDDAVAALESRDVDCEGLKITSDAVDENMETFVNYLLHRDGSPPDLDALFENMKKLKKGSLMKLGLVCCRHPDTKKCQSIVRDFLLSLKGVQTAVKKLSEMATNEASGVSWNEESSSSESDRA